MMLDQNDKPDSDGKRLRDLTIVDCREMGLPFTRENKGFLDRLMPNGKHLRDLDREDCLALGAFYEGKATVGDLVASGHMSFHWLQTHIVQPWNRLTA